MFALFLFPPEQKHELLLRAEVEEDIYCSSEASFCSWGVTETKVKMDFGTELMYIINLAFY